MQIPELDQSTTDALFRKSSATAAADTERNVVPLRFGATNSISSGQMHGLTALVQLFARGVSFRLGAWLGTSVTLSLVSAERILFSEFLGKIIPDASYIASWKMEPVNAACLAYMDMAFVDPIIDLLLGGKGSNSVSLQPGEITDIEASILDSVMEEMCAEFSNSWKSSGIEVHHQKRLLSSYDGQAMPVRDNALCLSFEMQIGTVQKSLQVLFSGLAADTLLRAIAEENAKRAPSAAMRQKLAARAMHFRYGASLQLPIVSVSALALNNLQLGSILPLRVSTGTPAVFMVAGTPMFYARPIAAGPHRAAYLDQTFSPSKPDPEKSEERA